MADSHRAYVPWSQLWFDLLLLGAAVVAPVASYLCDAAHGCHDWFARSGAITVLLAGYLGYRSLGRHYEKFFRNTERESALRTSANQHLIDRLTIGLAIGGTLIWAYGDKLFDHWCR